MPAGPPGPSGAMLVDPKAGRRVALNEGQLSVAAIDFSHDGTLAAVSYVGEKVIVYVAETGEVFRSTSPGSSVLSFSSDDKFLALAPEYHAFQVWDLASASRPRFGLASSVARFAFGEDGETLAVGTETPDGSTHVFQTGSFRALARFQHPGTAHVDALAVSPKGDWVASASNREVSVFAAHESAPVARLKHPGVPMPVVFSENGKVMAGVLENRLLIVTELGTDRELARIEVCNRTTTTLRLSTDGGYAVAGCSEEPARIVDVRRKKIVSEIPHEYRRPLLLSPDGKRVFSGDADSSGVFETETGRRIHALGEVRSAADFSADGRHLAFVAGEGVVVVDASSGRETARFRPEGLLESVALSTDGVLLAVGTRERYVHVYEVTTRRKVASLFHKEEEKQHVRISTIVFDAAGKSVATIAEDPTSHAERKETLRAFDIRSQTELIRVPFGETPWLLRFSADRTHLEVATGRRGIRIERFPLRSSDLVEDACARVERNLSRDEWSRYVGDLPYRETCPVLNSALKAKSPAR